MGIYRSFAGAVRVRLLTADGPACLQILERSHYSASSIRVIDSVTLELTISRKDLPGLRALCQRKGYTLEIIRKRGLYWPLHTMLSRPILLIGLPSLLLLTCLVTNHILLVSTEGNDRVPGRYILEQAGENGLKFWSSRRDVRSEQIKNALLEAIPQLQWVGVNTYGCRAVITVRERPEQPQEQYAPPVSHIAAARDGVIASCTVTRGFGNCTVGQAVRKGDILISGYTDCGLVYTAERAEGEILARTQRHIRIITPQSYQIQSSTGSADTRFSLLIGKKRINFYKGSGISGATCDKMYSKYVLTLPGGFTLPVALLKETTVSCDLTETMMQDSEQLLQQAAADYLIEQMTDGVIERRSETVTESEGIFLLTGIYDCLENIGITQEEKIGEINGKTDGTDRERRPGG